MSDINIKVISLYPIPLLQWSYVYCNKLSSKFSPDPIKFLNTASFKLSNIECDYEFIWPEREEVEMRNWKSKVTYFDTLTIIY